jgi:protein-S-isoprenylcysteine O-methyltransferase Ste14
MHSLDLRVPPPIVALLVALAMWAVSRAGFGPLVSDPVRLPLAIALACVGGAFDLAALMAFRRARTTVNPMKPQAASSIVRSGVYRLTRNPMYVGLAFVLCGWAVFLGSWLVLLGPIAFAAYITRFQILPEEKALSTLFGAEYPAYKAKVRRWL